ncbi:P-loop containing nucleoside triphosphate hydrolase protein, partial [Ochromonadaceae sp. CCMP2298]
MYEYQREGVRWMHQLFEEGVGGILGDEMGLGKTAQICGGGGRRRVQEQGQAQGRVGAGSIFLIVVPATVLHHWLQELYRWAPFMRSLVLHSISPTAAELMRLGDSAITRVLRRLQRSPCPTHLPGISPAGGAGVGLVVLATYEGLRRYRGSLATIEWTAVCLDEGQKIRNPETDITAVCKRLPAFHRMILSGTPIQNSLRELWSLVDFTYPGRLGSLPIFEQEFATPIRLGGYANANMNEHGHLQYEIAIRCAATLQKIVKPYLLRRKKDDLTSVTNLPPKTEQVLFCQISPRQRELYLNVLASDEVKAVLTRRMNAFRAINTLRKLCNHPALVYRNGQLLWSSAKPKNGGVGDVGSLGGGEGEGDGEGDGEDDRDELDALSKRGGAGIVWADSGKLLVLSKVLPLWHSEGHKVLVFSQTRGMLGVIESMVRELGFKYLRLDGSTPVAKRAGIVHRFNTETDIFVMLLTTRTGGVGISLTAANRVVLYDPDWNPMVDMQSRERTWRLGQTREVTVYRLITRGTIEEKIYQRQIFKLLLSNRVLENPNQKALFSQTHMRELFELNESFYTPQGRGTGGG